MSETSLEARGLLYDTTSVLGALLEFLSGSQAAAR